MDRRPVFVFKIGGTLLDSTGSIQAVCNSALRDALGDCRTFR